MTIDSDTDLSRLTELVLRGTKFRDDYEFELYGEEVTAILRPLSDDDYMPIAIKLAAYFSDGDGSTDEAAQRAEEQVEEARRDADELEDLNGVGDSLAEKLRDGGYDSVTDVAATEPEELAEIDGVGETLASEIREDALAAEQNRLDLSQFDDEFINIIQDAAKKGVWGAYYEDGDVEEYDEEEAEWLIDNMMGGASVEIGMQVLDLSADVQDAEKFRTGR